MLNKDSASIFDNKDSNSSSELWQKIEDLAQLQINSETFHDESYKNKDLPKEVVGPSMSNPIETIGFLVAQLERNLIEIISKIDLLETNAVVARKAIDQYNQALEALETNQDKKDPPSNRKN